MVVNILFIGATGYIGGTVLNLLLKYPDKYKITALVRSKEAAEKLKTLNVTPVLGSVDDADVLAKAVKETDMVIDIADSDNLSAAKTFIKALSESKTPKIFIHTSGTGVIKDSAEGNEASDDIYSDLDVKTIHAKPLSYPHREMDQYLIDHSDNVKLIIVAPPVVYGQGTGQFNHHSVIVPVYVQAFSKIGQAATIGKGLNIYSSIHVEDLADFYLLLLEKALKDKADFRKDGWYFPEAGDVQIKDLVTKMRDHLIDRKVIRKSEIREMTQAEVQEHIGKYIWGFGINCRTKGERSRALGWAPKRGDIFSTLEKEVDALLKKGVISSKE